jgi:hypothetical protein
MPETLNLEHLRAKGKQEGETELPEEVASAAGGATAGPQPSEALVADVGIVHLTGRDVQDTGLREASPFRAMATEVVRRTAECLDTAIVLTADAGTPAFAGVRGLSAFILRHVSNRHTHKVLAGLRLLQYLSPGLACTVEMQVNPVARTGTRLTKLKCHAVVFEARPPTVPPSAEASALLRAWELERLKLLLDLCRAAQDVEVPITNPVDKRKVRALALALGANEERLLTEWGRCSLYSARPQQIFAEALYRATFDWCLSLVNTAWEQQLATEPAAGAAVTVTHLPPMAEHAATNCGYDNFGAFVAQEAVSQQVADMLPLVDIGEMPPSMRPSVDEIPCLRDTVFAHAASGLFGEAGLLHFLASGCRSASSIASYIELVRDGDLAMRRYFGPRLREAVRVRAGELLVGFETPALSAATYFEPFSHFVVNGTDGPVWQLRDPSDKAMAPQSKVLRTVAGVDEITKTMRGDVVVAYMRPEDHIAGSIIPAPVRLCNLWKDQVSLTELTAHVQRMGLGPDPLQLLTDVYGAGARPYVVVGDDLHFAPGKLQELYVKIKAMSKAKGKENVGPDQPGAPRMDELPRSWKTPGNRKLGVQDHFMRSVPANPNTSIHARREMKDQVISDDVALSWCVPRDSRRRRTVRPDDDSARLMFTTCQLISSDTLFEKAQEDAENAAISQGRPIGRDAEFSAAALYGDALADRETRELTGGWKAPSMQRDGAVVNPAVVARLDKVRAIFRGRHERRLMAVLQMEHIAAERIQLSWLESRRKKNAAASTIQNAYRSQLFRDILRGMEQAKDLLRNEEQGSSGAGLARSGVRVPSGKTTQLTLPWAGGKVETSDISKLVRKVVTGYLGLPMDIDQKLVRIANIEAQQSTASVQITLDLPLRVRAIVEEMQEVVDTDRERGSRVSPLAPVIDLLGGWSVGLAKKGGIVANPKESKTPKEQQALGKQQHQQQQQRSRSPGASEAPPTSPNAPGRGQRPPPTGGQRRR